MTNTPDYQITLQDGVKVSFLFNTWTFRSFCRKQNIEMEDLLENVRGGKAFKGNDLPDLLLIAAESYLKFNNHESHYTDIDACIWVDTLGGVNSLKLVEIYKYFVGKLLNIAPEAFDVIWQKIISGENKSEGKTNIKKKKARRN